MKIVAYPLGSDSFWDGISLVDNAEDRHNNSQSEPNTSAHLALRSRSSNDPLPLLPPPLPANMQQHHRQTFVPSQTVKSFKIFISDVELFKSDLMIE